MNTTQLYIHHQTTYTYDAPVPYGLMQLRLRPKDNLGQRVLRWDVTIDGGKTEVEYTDHHHNHVALISFETDVTQLTITCEGEVALSETHGVVGPHAGFAPMWLFEQVTQLTTAGPKCRAIANAATGEVGTIDWAHSLSQCIRDAITYEIGKSEVGWTAEDAASAGHGVCQDHAHVFIACCRRAGVPARYVSGYLMMDDRTHQDATHAWAEAHIEGLGWVGFDVSNGISPDMRYVRVATGMDYADAAPVSGTRFGTASEELSVQLQVQQ